MTQIPLVSLADTVTKEYIFWTTSTLRLVVIYVVYNQRFNTDLNYSASGKGYAAFNANHTLPERQQKADFCMAKAQDTSDDCKDLFY